MTEPTPVDYDDYSAAQCAVDAVWPIAEATVRAKVAAEIRDAKPDVVLLTGHPFGEDERMITLDRAARIAEGKGDDDD